MYDDSIARLDERVKRLEANHEDIKDLIVLVGKLEQKIDDMSYKIISLCEELKKMNSELDCIKLVIERHSAYFKILGAAITAMMVVIVNLILI